MALKDQKPKFPILSKFYVIILPDENFDNRRRKGFARNACEFAFEGAICSGNGS
jgi:hypothetical protein